MRAKYDVLGIGNAIMDVIAPVDDDLLIAEDITKASMTLIDQDRALHLHSALQHTGADLTEIAGGSGANTIAGIAALGLSTAYMGKVANDGLGKRFTQSLRQQGVMACPLPFTDGTATARCLIAVTPDGERSMSTFLGANVGFGPHDVDPQIVRDSAVTYLEGYLFDTNDQKAAFVKAAEIAKTANRQVALTLSDSFCVDRHRASFGQLVDNHVDILFANEAELLSLFETNDLNAALHQVGKSGTTAMVTLSEKGSLIKHGETIHEIPPVSPRGFGDKLIDSTGAGDQYAAGVLAARALGMDWPDAGRLGSLCATEVITHYGARPEVRVHDLMVGGVG